jgi:hypothetical protein
VIGLKGLKVVIIIDLKGPVEGDDVTVEDLTAMVEELEEMDRGSGGSDSGNESGEGSDTTNGVHGVGGLGDLDRVLT